MTNERDGDDNDDEATFDDLLEQHKDTYQELLQEMDGNAIGAATVLLAAVLELVSNNVVDAIASASTAHAVAEPPKRKLKG